MKLRATYANAASLLADVEQQFSRGGLLVRVDPLPKVELYEAIELELVAPQGSAVIAAQVIQMLPGMGIAVGFDGNATQAITGLIEAARKAPNPGAAQPATFTVDGADAAVPGPERAAASTRPRASVPVDARTKIKNASQAEKVQIALHGNKEERMLLVRGGNRLIHQYVLKNPKIQIDEIANIAGLRTVSPELLKMIAARREWAQRPEIALALVRNPKTPVPLAVKLVDHVPHQHLRQLAKAGSVKAPIQKAARKKVTR